MPALVLRYSVLLSPLLLLSGCGEPPEPEGRGEAVPAGEVAATTATQEGLPEVDMDPALFDSIGWESPREAVRRGATVYAYSCARCHGDRGAGDGNYRLEGRLLKPTSFHAADWQHAGDLPGLREAIFSGSRERGMPHWGNAGLPPRDVDAVAHYILYGLRAER